MPEIFIYDEIGPAYYGMIDAKGIIDQLAKYRGQQVTMRINSPGGSVWEATAIYHAMRAHQGGVVSQIDGIAASAATLVASGGSRVDIADGAQYMIHNAWTITLGGIKEHEASIGALANSQDFIRNVYAARTGMTSDDIQTMLDAETWMTAAQAVERKFADALIGKIDAPKARIKEGRYRNTPAALLTSELPREQQRKVLEQHAALRSRLTNARHCA